MGYIRISYIKYRRNAQKHDYLQVNVIKPYRGKYRKHNYIQHSVRYNIKIHTKDKMIDIINDLKKYYEVDTIILASTKTYPSEVKDYFRGTSLQMD